MRLQPWVWPAASASEKKRHLDTSLLWVQSQVRSGQVKLEKVPGVENPGDAMTKHLLGPDLMKHVDRMKLRFEEGRPESAPQLTSSVLQAMHEDKEVVRQQKRMAKRGTRSPAPSLVPTAC